MARIILLIAEDGFQVREYGDTKNVLETAGHVVFTATMKKTVAVSNIGTQVPVDIFADTINVDEYDALYVVGGPGALSSLNNEIVHNLLKRFSQNETRRYGAICIAPRILAEAGVLSGVKVTGWNLDGKFEDICKGAGAIYVAEPVVVDGRVITADGPLSAKKFGETIASQW
jgi:protease I